MDGRARDVVDDRDVRVGEGRRAVDLDARVFAPGAPRHRDVDLRPAPVAELEERGRGAVGQDRAWAAGEHRRHPEALALEEMPRDYGVDAGMLAVEAAGAERASGPRGRSSATCVTWKTPCCAAAPTRPARKSVLQVRFLEPARTYGDAGEKHVTGVRQLCQSHANGAPELTGMPTRSRANPGGNQNVLDVLGPDVLPLRARKPPWFKVPAPGSPRYRQLKGLIESENLHTVCQEAACPNIGECWQRGTATFMILGDTCTRRCGFCNVKTGKPTWNDPLEPARVARSGGADGPPARGDHERRPRRSPGLRRVTPSSASSARSAGRRRNARSRF